MFDTVAIRQPSPRPLGCELERRGWDCVRPPGGRVKWVLNREGHPSITWSAAPNGVGWRTAEGSIPKLVRGSNVQMVDERDVEKFLNETSAYVSSVTGRDFDAHTALVGRVDICHNLKAVEWNIVPHIYAVASVSISRMNRTLINDATVYFQNESKRDRLTERLMVYDKRRQMMEEGRTTPEELKAAHGVLRLEHRFNGDSVRRLAKRYKVSRRADDLLKTEIARDVLKMDMERTNLDKPKADYDDRPDILLKAYGGGSKLRSLMGFLSLLDRYGEDFWQIDELRYGRTTYFANAGLCRNVGVWRRNEHPAKLPALRLAWDSDARARGNNPLSNTVSLSPAGRTP